MVAEFCAVRPENTKSAVRSSGDGCRLGVPIEPVPGSHFKSSTYDTHRLALGLTGKPIITGSVRDSGGSVIRNSMAYELPTAVLKLAAFSRSGTRNRQSREKEKGPILTHVRQD